MLFADTNLRSPEATVNNELINVCDWLTANKLTLDAKKSNFVIFRPRQKKFDYKVNLNVINNDTNALTPLQKRALRFMIFSKPRGSCCSSVHLF